MGALAGSRILCRVALVVALPLFAVTTPSVRAQADDPPDLRKEMPSPDAAEAASGVTVSPSELEMQMKLWLLRKSLGMGGPPPSAPGSAPGRATDPAQERRQAQERRCAHYSNPSARNACMHGDYWQADRIQQNRSTRSECAGYGGWQCEKQR